MGAPRAMSDHLPNKHLSERTLRRCNSKKRDNIVLIDVDSDDFGDVIILDVPDSFKEKFRKKPKNVISIDDDDNGCESSNEGLPKETVHPSTSTWGNEENTPVKLSKSKRTYSGKETSRNRYGLSLDSEMCSSESDCSDCELIEGSSRKVREQWEKASYKKRNDYNVSPSNINNEAGTSGPTNSKNGSIHHDDGDFEGSAQGFSEDSEQVEDSMEIKEEFTSKTTNPSRDILEEGKTSDLESPFKKNNVSNCSNENLDANTINEVVNNGDNFVEVNMGQQSDGILSLIPDDKFDHNSLITDRQKIKETEEYKNAMEEEWAARQQQLLQQAEEARRLRNKKKAENMRIMMNEKRQKERLEEIRQTRIRDEENLNIKEKYRAEIRKELHRIEAISYDMASLLRSLGIHVNGGPFASQNEVQVAYKRACLKFHPDRISGSDLRQQVEAEEKFKLISNMKDKLMFR